MDNRFTDIIQLIKQSRTNAIKAVNAELINLYWSIGEYISKKIEQSDWGDSVVTELANFIQTHEPEIKGFSDKNIWRMKQFYETYKDFPKLSTLLREISWNNNLRIFQALNLCLSPTLVSEYKTQLPDKKLLQQKLHELFDNEPEEK